MGSFLLFAAVVIVCVLMLWASYKMEPHWVSKDGERMICYGQGLKRGGQSIGRWRELRISKIRHDTLEVRPRRGTLSHDDAPRGPVSVASGMIKGRGPKASYWKVVGQAATPLRNRVMYILDGNSDPSLPDLIAIRLPAKSKAIPMLEAMVRGVQPAPKAAAPDSTDPITSKTAAPAVTEESRRGTGRSAARPDPG